MRIILKYSDYGHQKDGPKISHVVAIGPFDTQQQAEDHARTMRLQASERWYYSICDLIVPAPERLDSEKSDG